MTFSQRRGRHLVLLIAISENRPKYDNIESTLYDLAHFEKFLIAKMGVKQEDILKFINKEATIENLDEAINVILQKALKLNSAINQEKSDEKILITVYASCHGFMRCTSHIYLPNGDPEGDEPGLGTGAYYDIEGKLHSLQDSLKHAFIIGVMDCCRNELPSKGTSKPYSPPKKGSLCMIYATRPGDAAFV